jgi:acetyl-CoA carboxylase biotin carboxyl carrier protein
MEFEQILKLIDHVSQSPLTSFQYEGEHLKLSMERLQPPCPPPAGMQVPPAPPQYMPQAGMMSPPAPPQYMPPAGMMIPPVPPQSEGMVPQVLTAYSQNAAAGVNAADQSGNVGDTATVADQMSANASSGEHLKIVKSPLVGVFYAAPAEDADAFVRIGDQVKQGQILSIVEAMKLMNEIESDFDGEIAEIYVKNGETVEYGQPLFGIR